MEQTANTTRLWVSVWVLAIGVIVVGTSLQPDWEFMRQSVWAWPVTEYLHVIGLVGFFALRTTIDLRLINTAFGRQPLGDLLRRLVPATVVFATITVVTGLALYSASPDIMSARPMFQVKVAVMIVALLNLCYLHAFALARVAAHEPEDTLPISGRIAAVLSMTLWIAVIVASMLIPYID